MMMNDKEYIQRWKASPVAFIKDVWKLSPQPVNDDVVFEYIDRGEWDKVKAEHFNKFIKGKHITWQQWLILLSIERALVGKGKRRISIASGHGVGKSATLSWLIIWFLMLHKNAQIPCTAPTSDQIHDVLWKELSIWLSKMPSGIQAYFDWSTGYLRINESPETWFARARTARKENPEALAGIHADDVMFALDEASGIAEEIFLVAEGALTGPNVLVIMISNPTRLLGYFYDSHHADKKNWQVLQFSSIDSPIVDHEFVERISERHGESSDEYKIRVLGQFPAEDAVDDKGYVPLFIQSDLKHTEEVVKGTEMRLGVDPSGEGDDETTWVLRDNFVGQIPAKEKISNPKGIAQRTISIAEKFNILDRDIFVDAFGIGMYTVIELERAGWRVQAVNAGDKPADEIYLNLRAEMYSRTKEWVRSGGEFSQQKGWEELLTIRYRRNLSGRLQIMPKDEMRKQGYRSPNIADALSLTFAKKITKRPEPMDDEELKRVTSIY